MFRGSCQCAVFVCMYIGAWEGKDIGIKEDVFPKWWGLFDRGLQILEFKGPVNWYLTHSSKVWGWEVVDRKRLHWKVYIFPESKSISWEPGMAIYTEAGDEKWYSTVAKYWEAEGQQGSHNNQHEEARDSRWGPSKEQTKHMVRKSNQYLAFPHLTVTVSVFISLCLSLECTLQYMLCDEQQMSSFLL